MSANTSHMDPDQEDWSEIYEELVGEIAKRLPSLEDFLRLGMVCRSWRSITVQKHYYPTRLQFSPSGGGCCLPWLMLRERQNKDDNIRDFFSLWENKLYHLTLPEIHGKRCWGTPFGWVITIGLDRNINLINPLTHVQIHLPPQPTFQHQDQCIGINNTPENVRQWFLRKVIIAPPTTTSLSSDSSNRFLALAIYSLYAKLAVARPGDKAWTTLDAPLGAYKDVIFFNGQFYAVKSNGDVIICEISGPNPPKGTFFTSPPEDVEPWERFYLLELAGELHMVVRMYEPEGYEDRPPGSNIYYTHFFEVYKLDLVTRKWTELMSFDDHALFVGDNTAFSVSTAQHPECKGNCIYFTDDSYEGNTYDFGRDTGVFDFKDETIRPFDIVRDDDSRSSFSGPVWITPNLW